MSLRRMIRTRSPRFWIRPSRSTRPRFTLARPGRLAAVWPSYPSFLFKGGVPCRVRFELDSWQVPPSWQVPRLLEYRRSSRER